MERVRLDQHALQIQLTEQQPQQHGPLLVFTDGVAGLADGYAQCSGVQCDLGNER